jgi:hypothetical protein
LDHDGSTATWPLGGPDAGQVDDKDPKNLILVIADMARSKPELVSFFVAECARRHGRSEVSHLEFLHHGLQLIG